VKTILFTLITLAGMTGTRTFAKLGDSNKVFEFDFLKDFSRECSARQAFGLRE
jgi:hypothetical protein